ncbi:hypothetical protein X760_07810 [Mesorhizobium sp. LSHC422A00]|uniref:ATP-binding protein n=1 Tax=Mesorhizobium sp. LSHC422A00 TaxID=1287294 RepID=UPI0003CE4DF5|nr:ATP-binding protein [Mesorhizobium sp. LSHC422A00]ESX61922.1 hypothetical protein X760_07810 [Mesorhizobium sp. LSHC422A00]
MFPSLSQIVTSLDRLSGVHPFFGYAFLGFKKAELPVDSLEVFRYSDIKANILEKYFRIDGVEKRFFNPFNSPKRWVNDRYDSTSLQRIIADTFGEAFLRDPSAHEWGWLGNYVNTLHDLLVEKSDKIPLVDIAVWLFRKDSLIAASKRDAADYLVSRLIHEFHLTRDELEALFDGLDTIRDVELAAVPVSDADLLNFIGFPEDYTGDYPVSLSELSIRNVGPFRNVQYHASRRLNLLAGDNSLGKTFLLELIWWALTGSWNILKADPLRSHSRVEMELSFDMSVSSGLHVVVPYNRVENDWQRPQIGYQDAVLYFGFDGNVTIFSPPTERDGAETPFHSTNSRTGVARPQIR